MSQNCSKRYGRRLIAYGTLRERISDQTLMGEGRVYGGGLHKHRAKGIR